MTGPTRSSRHSGKAESNENRLLPGERGVLPARPDRAGQAGRAGRVPRALDLRPLPPVERRAGPQRLRVVGDRRARGGDVAAGDHRRDLPDDAHPPGGDRPGRRDQRRPARGPLQRSASAAARRSTSTSSATTGPRPTCGWRCSRRPSRSSARCGRAASTAIDGRHYTVENARVYDLPDELPPMIVSGFGPKAIKLAARIGDGFATTSPDKDAIDLYRSEGGKGPVHAGTKVCFGPTRKTRARPSTGCGRTRRCRANSPRSCRRRRTSSRRASWSRPTRSRRRSVRIWTRTSRRCAEYEQAGVDELFVQQIGPDHARFFDEWAPAVLERFHA